MRARERPSAASFVNWVGRTVRQIREESALQRALAARVPRRPLAAPGEAERVRRELAAWVAAKSAPAGWR